MTFQLKYYTCLYITVRVIRETLHSTLPIEVLYASPDKVPHEIIAHMENTLEDVRFVNIYQVKDFPKGVSMQGYQIKAFSLLFASFEEFMFLDTDNIPLQDPKIVFDFPLYKKTGALFWPDYCNMHASVLEAWDIFGFERPPAWFE